MPLIFFLLWLAVSSCAPKQEERPVESANEQIQEETAEQQSGPRQEADPGSRLPAEETQMPDTEKNREYFKEGVKHFEQGSYQYSEFYLKLIEDSYPVLQDHIFYYLAKGLLLQGKYRLSEKYYISIIDEHPCSIWAEKAALEYADLYFIEQNYAEAEQKYQKFYDLYPESGLIPYCLYQLGICRENNGDIDGASQSYKQLWLSYPDYENAGLTFSRLEIIIRENELDPFIPSAEQLIKRAEIFFSRFLYYDSLDQLNHVLANYQLQENMRANIFFKMGMSYYNLGNYEKASEYLLQAYDASQEPGIGDAALYFLGRAETNLVRNQEALSYYRQLVDQYPQSNYADDALYRSGRIYFFDQQLDNAISSYGRLLESYPYGDRFREVSWELGWIHYCAGDYLKAEEIFADMSERFRGSDLEEKGLFWQAKCMLNTGRKFQAVDIFENINTAESYSYYKFMSQQILSQQGIETDDSVPRKSAIPSNPLIKEVVPQVFQPLEEGSESEPLPMHISKALELLRLEMTSSAAAEIEAGKEDIDGDPLHLLMLSTLYHQSLNYPASIGLLSREQRALKSSLQSPYLDYYYYLLYPYGYESMVNRYAQSYNVEPEFILAVIRQESHFRPDAVSHAGAQGLMQIMPATGQGIAQKLDLADYDQQQLLDPRQNIMMGTFYLREMLDNFNENKFYAAAAYNGGPGNMAAWLARWPDMDIYELVENIPYDETRDYVKKVIANYYVYQLFYN